MHPDGYIELRDRAKDIIISGGEKSPRIEVEQAIWPTPACGKARLSRSRTSAGGACPTRSSRSRTAPRPARRDRRLLPPAARSLQVPRRAIAFGSLPKTSTGKVRKFVLREPEWAAEESRIN